MPTLLDLAEIAMPELTESEVRVVEGAAVGGDVDFANRVDIGPDVVRWLCTNPEARKLVDPRGVRLRNARITGPLDLRNTSIEFYLRLHLCNIDGDVNLNDARVGSIGFNGSSCTRLLAWRAQVSGDLFLEMEGVERFRSAQVLLNDATVSGNVSLEGARLGPATEGGPSLAVDRAQVRGLIILSHATLTGTFSAYDAQLGGLDARGAQFAVDPSAGDSRAVAIVRSTVKGEVSFQSLSDSITAAVGTLSLVGSVVGGNVDLTGAQVEPSETSNVGAAADADPDNTDDGEEDPQALPDLLDLRLSRIGGHLLMRRTILTDGSVTLWDADIGQDLILDQYHDAGEGFATGNRVVHVLVVSTRVGKALHWTALTPEDAVVSLSGSTVDRLVHHGITAWPARGRLWLDGLRYRVIEGPTLYRRQRLAGPSRRIRNRKHVGKLTWRLRFLLRLTDAVAGADATELRWLRLHTRRVYDAQPYDTLASALRTRGLDAEAVRVLIARADDRRRARGPLRVLLGLPYRWLVGNGFRTWWAALWIPFFTVVGTAVFGAAYDRGELLPVKPVGEVLPFQPFVYSLDVLLPIVNLGQADAFLPTAASAAGVRAYFWVQICLGWLLATALAASAAAALQRRGSS